MILSRLNKREMYKLRHQDTAERKRWKALANHILDLTKTHTRGINRDRIETMVINIDSRKVLKRLSKNI